MGNMLGLSSLVMRGIDKNRGRGLAAVSKWWFVLLGCLFFKTASSQIVPSSTRLVFEGATQVQVLSITNNGPDTARFSVSMVEMRMKSNGKMERITSADSGQVFASKYIQFFPDHLILAPNDSQRIAVRFQGTPPPGECRSHLLLKPARIKCTAVDSAAGASCQQKQGITIPVIIRQGDLTASVNLSDISVTSDTAITLHLTFNRTGEMSVYGDISVDYIPPDGDAISVGEAKHVAVYTPNKARQLNVRLKHVDGIDYHSGKLTIQYKGANQSDVLASAELQLH
jgi:hypothetical protein